MSPIPVFLALLSAPGPITQSEFDSLRKDLTPSEAEAWQLVPWKVDLLAARDEARESKRPIFLWSMNGHPLGCT